MINFERYPHVKDYINHYAIDLNNQQVIELLVNGVVNQSEAEDLSRFIWQMVDRMSIDCDNDKIVLGQIDNSDIFADLQYEITLYLTKLGYMEAWNKVRDQQNP